jgi:hypothetical protein
MFKLPEYIWRTYLVEFTKYGKRVFEELTYLDVVGEPERSVGSTVTVNVNKQKRIGIIHGIA